MTGRLPPPLPCPALARWQPLRMGLVDLYLYDSEEFWFRDGHLLLRGNNGTGKSKVLSLTLPFLLDATLSSARIEPDGDPGKRMAWNLLLNGRHERRTGYAWIEFGRQDEAEGPVYLTLGCGMAALAGKPRVDAWYFVAERRIGQDLHLISPERVVLTRERLAEALGDRGQVFDTARDYRRCVDERLFRLGDERYAALMDTLITLRQPQLSKRPDEATLSKALTEALPPLPQEALDDVAEALTQLDEYRDELKAHEDLLSAVAQFQRRYGHYARVNARREAHGLRHAQTEFDNASRSLNAASEGLEKARARVDEHETQHAALQASLAREQAALEVLQRDPALRDAQALRQLTRDAEERREEAERSVHDHEGAERRHVAEQEATRERRRDVEIADTRLRAERNEAHGLAAECGMAHEHDEIGSALTAQGPDRAERDLRAAVQRRQQQVARVRAQLAALNQRAMERNTASGVRAQSAEAFEQARESAGGAARALEEEGKGHITAWTEYVRSLAGLRLPMDDAALDELAAWTQSLHGEHPLQGRVRAAHAAAVALLAQRKAGERGSLDELRRGQQDLLDEERRLREGAHATPPPTYTRDPQVRRELPGAPFWQLLEFRDHVPPHARAGLEAALEGAGLLDAWVTPEGSLSGDPPLETLLVARNAQRESLRDWLVPSRGAPVPADRVESILASIACGPVDASDAEAWIAPDGRYRLGPAAGAWRKEAAEYIGYAAREAARRRRLEELAAALASLEIALARCRAVLDEIEAAGRALECEITGAPGDGGLRAAHARSSEAEANRRRSQDRLARDDAALGMAEAAWRDAQALLARDAEDLRLPATEPGLSTVESALMAYRACGSALTQSARGHETACQALARQERREADADVQLRAARDENERRERRALVAESRRDELKATAGSAVAEIERRIGEREGAVRETSGALEEEARLVARAREERGGASERQRLAQQALDEKQARRQEAIERFRRFALTDMLSVALPALEVPPLDADWTIEPALTLARRAEQGLTDTSAEEESWRAASSAVSHDFTALTQATSSQGHSAEAEVGEFGMVVHIAYHGRPERPDILAQRLEAEIAERRQILSAREREVFENHIQAEIAASLQRLLADAERRVRRINAELERRPTSTGVRFRLDWQALPEGDEGAPVGLKAARVRLLNMAAEAWSPEDRRLVGEFLQKRIESERSRDEVGSLTEHLSRALDYRRWHRFRVERQQDGVWRPLSGPASSGERALGLTVPLFAAASSHYASGSYAHAPRLVLLDEAFAGIDDEARAHCMALIREFDLDFVMTSEREWGCYAELPGLAICNLVRQEGVDAVLVSRWSWDGKARRAEPDPARRYPEHASESV